MLAATNDGRYMEHGKVIEVPGEDLFKHYWLKSVPGAGVFEAYVNRDALPYLKIYGIEDASGMYRGTLRNVGYCETWDFIKQLGLLNRKMKFDFDEVTPREVLANIVNCPERRNLRAGVAAYLKIPEHSLTLKKLEWLGLLSDRKLKIGTASVFDMFAHTLKNGWFTMKANGSSGDASRIRSHLSRPAPSAHPVHPYRLRRSPTVTAPCRERWATRWA
jgi:hypothetical protein